MIKVLITDKLAQEGIDLLNSMDGVQAVVKIGISEDELAGIIGEYDGLIIRSGTQVTAKVLARIGADEIVMPEDESADRWTRKLVSPQFLNQVELDRPAAVFTLGPATYKAAEAAGLTVTGQARSPSLKGLLEAMRCAI